MGKLSKREESSVERVFDRLRARVTRRVPHPTLPKTSITELDLLERMVRELIAADEQIARADGYAVSTPGNGSPGGGKGGRQQMCIQPDEPAGVCPRRGCAGRTCTDPEHRRVPADELDTAWVPTSPTEAPALEVLTGRSVADPVHRLRVRVVGDLHAAAEALQRARDGVAEWEELRAIRKVEDPPYCYIAQVVCSLPWDPYWTPEHRTDFAGVLDPKLDEARLVSMPMYRFIRKHRRLPTQEQALGLLTKGVTRVSA